MYDSQAAMKKVAVNCTVILKVRYGPFSSTRQYSPRYNNLSQIEKVDPPVTN